MTLGSKAAGLALMMFILDCPISWTFSTVLQQLVHWQLSQNTPVGQQWHEKPGREGGKAYEQSRTRPVAAHQLIDR